MKHSTTTEDAMRNRRPTVSRPAPPRTAPARPAAGLRGTALLVVWLALSACTTFAALDFNQRYSEAHPRDRIQPFDSAAAQRYREQVAPLLQSRCVACHACYDAPCQLKLTASAGIDRGLSEVPVYSGKRLIAADPTRLFIDATSTAAWRERGFQPVLNERRQDSVANLHGSLLYRVLQLKQNHPLPEGPRLSEETFDFALNRDNHCPSIEEFDDYADANPLAGMPYGLPGLDADELALISDWLQQGAPLSADAPLSSAERQQVSTWETFLNRDTRRAQLVARYLYEHLFLADLYFADLDAEPQARRYFSLVRSRTPPGEAIDIIASRRPVDDPGIDRPYYRLQASSEPVITKTHLPYALDRARLDWLQQLFFEPHYEVRRLPGYQAEFFNPFNTFRDLPADSRYRFLLREAHFFIAGFIKGPVCRGPVAVDVINDHFWVFFIDPDADALPMLDGFLEQQSRNLRLPGEQGSNAGILAYWTTYSDLHRKYLLAKARGLADIFQKHPPGLDLIWDGDGHNPNAALTVLRNFDDAAVIKGLLGGPPKTAWVVDYPLLERIHYLLTADFDVYGNVGHQLNTRLYMDFLRIEGEYNFLTLLPPQRRVEERDFWYRKASKRLHDQLYSYDLAQLPAPAIAYRSEHPKLELYQYLQDHLAGVLSDRYSLARAPREQRQALEPLAQLEGRAASLMSETSLLLVEDGDDAQLYTLLANRAHLNITSLFREQKNRLPGEDTLSIAYGVIGDYPNTFLKVSAEELPQLVAAIGALDSEEAYAALLDRYGVRRTDPGFWAHSDRLQALFRKRQPAQAGWLDYNRLENR